MAKTTERGALECVNDLMSWVILTALFTAVQHRCGTMLTISQRVSFAMNLRPRKVYLTQNNCIIAYFLCRLRHQRCGDKKDSDLFKHPVGLFGAHRFWRVSLRR